MDITQMIALLETIVGFSDFFSGSADIMSGSGDMADGTANLVAALGENGALNEIVASFLSGSLGGPAAEGSGSLGSLAEVGSAALGSATGS
ncbi:hypothetical protein [Tomitella biformata]|uniref:hypothetical protein n=1 Tax=Tomitella biformata TaxID=630403 RepID=UPI0004652FFD|nr:hypothetical protein [Tomitella biformata]